MFEFAHLIRLQIRFSGGESLAQFSHHRLMRIVHSVQRLRSARAKSCAFSGVLLRLAGAEGKNPRTDKKTACLACRTLVHAGVGPENAPNRCHVSC